MTRRTGQVSSFPSDKNFGFISPHDGEGDVFFHLSESRYESRYGRPKAGDKVSFEDGDISHGRIRAENVDLVERRGLR